MPLETDIRLADGDHVVHFYAAEDDLVGAAVGYLSGAVRAGDAAIVIATPAHRRSFDAALRAAGVDVEAAHREGRLVVVDAVDALRHFMVDGVPDPAAFEALIGGVVRSASAGGCQVRAYGEMVSVLWDDDNVTGAIELEKLWNGLAERLPFSLFCAYPAEMVGAPHAADAFTEVCHLHSGVVAGAPTPEGADVTRRFAGTCQAPRLARQFVSETLRDWDQAVVVDDAVLVVGELATNAVIHAASDFTVALSRRDGGVRLEVGDASAAAPAPTDAGLEALGGRGLRLVGAIGHEWGHRVVDGGKLVSVELRAATTTAENGRA